MLGQIPAEYQMNSMGKTQLCHTHYSGYPQKLPFYTQYF